MAERDWSKEVRTTFEEGELEAFFERFEPIDFGALFDALLDPIEPEPKA